MLIRPPQHSDESAGGHLLRLADENGIEPAWIESTHKIRITSPGLGWARWCSACMAKPAPYWRQDWTFGPGICAEHQCWLTDHCVSCGRRASWRGLLRRHCRCGARLQDVRPIRWTQSLVELINRASADAGQGWAVFDFKQRWKLAEVLGALDAYGLHGKPLKRASARSTAHHHALVERGAFILVQEEDELPRLFDRLRVSTSASQQVQLTSEAWPGLLPMLKGQLSAEPFQWISDRIDQVGTASRAAKAAVLQRRKQGQSPSGARKLATELGVRVERIPNLLSSCNLKLPERLTKTGRRMLVVGEGDVQFVTRHLKDQIAARVAQRRYGLSRARLEQLWCASMVSRCDDRYQASSIECLLRKVASSASDQLASPELSDDGMALLPHLLRVAIPQDRTAEFLGALIDGVIRVRCLRSTVRSAADLAASRSDVAAWLAKRMPAEDFLLIPQAAQQLKIKQEVFYHLVRVGLLVTSTRRLGRRSARVVGLVEIERFQREVASLAAVARANGVDVRAAKAWASRTGLEFLSGPGIDNGRQFFVRIGR